MDLALAFGFTEEFAATIIAEAFEVNIRWHLFWQQYRDGKFNISACSTKDHCADYFTKGLPRELFERNRKVVQGW
jgi:hypothetical protein